MQQMQQQETNKQTKIACPSEKWYGRNQNEMQRVLNVWLRV